MNQSIQVHPHKEFGGIILSPRCHCRCLFCHPTSKRRDEIKKQKINALKNLLEFKRRGIRKIEISGGDPIEYEDICQLITFIKKINFEFVQLSTHGMRLSDDKFLKDLMRSGVTRLRIPIYGSSAGIHDSVTRTKGSFDATCRGLRNLLKSKARVEVQISSLIMQQNKDDLPGIANLVKELGADDFYFSIPFIFDNDFSYAVPYQELPGYLKGIARYCQRIGQEVSFLEIPHCVFGTPAEQVNNRCRPPDLGENCQPPEIQKTVIKDLPKYRLKTKAAICRQCLCDAYCDGFLVNYVEKFGLAGMVPVNDGRS